MDGPRVAKSCMRRRNAAALVVAFALVVAGISVGLGACSSSGSILPKIEPKAVLGGDERPNVVLIQADDQTVAQFNRQVMPRTFKTLVDKGTSFGDYIATTALCCPSRASLITGQYADNHGVFANRGARGGYQALRDKENVLPVWLQQSGYRTFHVGAKYLNGYREAAGSQVAPGWSKWFTVLSHTQYYDYTLSRDGHHQSRDDRPGNYISRVLGNQARRLIDPTRRNSGRSICNSTSGLHTSRAPLTRTVTATRSRSRTGATRGRFPTRRCPIPHRSTKPT